MRTIELTPYEWQSLGCLPQRLDNNQVPADHKRKFILLGVASEKGENLVTTFEGRLMLREHKQPRRV